MCRLDVAVTQEGLGVGDMGYLYRICEKTLGLWVTVQTVSWETNSAISSIHSEGNLCQLIVLLGEVYERCFLDSTQYWILYLKMQIGLK